MLRRDVSKNKIYYFAYPDEIARVRIVEEGTSDFNLRHVPRKPVVIRFLTGVNQGLEDVVSKKDLFESMIAAVVRGQMLLKV